MFYGKFYDLRSNPMDNTHIYYCRARQQIVALSGY